MDEQSHSDNRKLRISLIAGIAALCLALVSAYTLVAALKSLETRESRLEDRAADTPSSIGLFLDNPQLEHSIGNIVFFNDVHLLRGPTESILFAQDDAGRRVLVLWNAASKHLPENGGAADVMGVITPLPALTTMKREWKLSKTEIPELRKSPVYIEATRIRTANHLSR